MAGRFLDGSRATSFFHSLLFHSGMIGKDQSKGEPVLMHGILAWFCQLSDSMLYPVVHTGMGQKDKLTL